MPILKDACAKERANRQVRLRKIRWGHQLLQIPIRRMPSAPRSLFRCHVSSQIAVNVEETAVVTSHWIARSVIRESGFSKHVA